MCKPTDTTPLDFSSKPNPQVVAQFLVDVIRGIIKHPDIFQQVAASDLTGTPEELYARLNAPAHPVRNGLIAQSIKFAWSCAPYQLPPSNPMQLPSFKPPALDQSPPAASIDVAHELEVLDKRIQRIAALSGRLQDSPTSDAIRDIAGTLEIFLNLLEDLHEEGKL